MLKRALISLSIKYGNFISVFYYFFLLSFLFFSYFLEENFLISCYLQIVEKKTGGTCNGYLFPLLTLITREMGQRRIVHDKKAKNSAQAINNMSLSFLLHFFPFILSFFPPVLCNFCFHFFFSFFYSNMY